MKRVVIIGGGITGLATAQRIIDLDQTNDARTQLIVLEASSRLGGIVHTERRDGFLLEHGPDSFISEKPAALKLIRHLNLESQLIQTNETHRRSFIVRKGKLLPVPAGFHLLAPARLWPFLTSPIFSWPGKARMAMELVLPRRKMNGSADESLASFVRRRLGAEALERMAQAMVGGIYTADPEQLSLRATFPRFLDWEQKHGSVIRALRRSEGSSGSYGDSELVTRDTSGARYSLFLSFGEGMQVLSNELSKRIAPSARVELNCQALKLHFVDGNWNIQTDRGTVVADAVCLTTPAYVSAHLMRDAHVGLANALAEIKYESSGTINLAYKRSQIGHVLDGFGFVVPAIERRSLIACTFSSAKFAQRAPGDHVLLRAFVGGALQRGTLELDDHELLQRVINDLNELLNIDGQPLFTTIARWERAMPQYQVGHLQRVERIGRYAAELPGLKLAGAAYSGVGIPDCVKSGESAAEDLLVGVR